MSLFEEWRQAMEACSKDEQLQEKFWKAFLLKEQHVYEDLLGKKDAEVSGVVKAFGEEHNMNPMEVLGFLDGISESLASECPDLEALTEDSEFAFTIDFEKLYWNMLAVPAEWLYTLPQWDAIIPEERRAEITKTYKNRNTVRREEPKIGRNDPCPCGSGKKYKKCCGR